MGFPALYIVLTGLRKKADIGFHGGQALVLWTWFFLIFFLLRFLVNLIWSLVYIPYLNYLENGAVILMGGYAAYCAYRVMLGRGFRIPY